MADQMITKRKSMDLYYAPEEIRHYLRMYYRKYPPNEKNIITTDSVFCKNHHSVVATYQSPYKRPGVFCNLCAKKPIENEPFFFRCKGSATECNGDLCIQCYQFVSGGVRTCSFFYTTTTGKPDETQVAPVEEGEEPEQEEAPEEEAPENEDGEQAENEEEAQEEQTEAETEDRQVVCENGHPVVKITENPYGDENSVTCNECGVPNLQNHDHFYRCV